MRSITTGKDGGSKESQPPASRPDDVSISRALRKETQHGRAYSYLVDTLATISFWTPVGMAQEIAVAGMTVSQSLKVRGISFGISLFAARPYGIYRNRVFKLLRTTEETGQVRRYWTDYLAFNTFWIPVYAGMLAVGGGDPDQIAKACVASLFATMVTGKALRRLLRLREAEGGPQGRVAARRQCGKAGPIRHIYLNRRGYSVRK